MTDEDCLAWMAAKELAWEPCENGWVLHADDNLRAFVYVHDLTHEMLPSPVWAVCVGSTRVCSNFQDDVATCKRAAQHRICQEFEERAASAARMLT